jgi:hypothetical protein
MTLRPLAEEARATGWPSPASQRDYHASSAPHALIPQACRSRLGLGPANSLTLWTQNDPMAIGSFEYLWLVNHAPHLSSSLPPQRPQVTWGRRRAGRGQMASSVHSRISARPPDLILIGIHPQPPQEGPRQHAVHGDEVTGSNPFRSLAGLGRDPECVYPRSREPDASARRPTPRIHRRADAVLGVAARSQSPGHTLYRGAFLDRQVVCASRRSLVAGVGLSRPPRGPDGAAAVRGPWAVVDGPHTGTYGGAWSTCRTERAARRPSNMMGKWLFLWLALSLF